CISQALFSLFLEALCTLCMSPLITLHKPIPGRGGHEHSHTYTYTHTYTHTVFLSMWWGNWMCLCVFVCMKEAEGGVGRGGHGAEFPTGQWYLSVCVCVCD